MAKPFSKIEKQDLANFLGCEVGIVFPSSTVVQRVLEYVEKNDLMGPDQIINLDSTLFKLLGPPGWIEAARVWDHLRLQWQLKGTE